MKEIAGKFKFEGVIKEIIPFGNGLINDTFKVETVSDQTPDYILQKINHNIFKDVDLLQDNIQKATIHIRKKLAEAGEKDLDRKVITIVPTVDGKLYHFTGSEYWRMILFIPRSKTFEAVTPESSYFAGKAFGNFQSMLVDIPTPLQETIPNFHNIEFRLQGFKDVVAKNPMGRLEKAQWMVDELLKREDEMCKAERLHREGKLPKRINHCDTKVNNMLFDENGEVLCVIDLDTTMPGYVLSDFGDFIRTGANTGAEDDEDLNNVNLNMEIFKAFAKGYLESAKSFLLPVEIENLPYGAKLLTYMQTVRFLADYIDGDNYYKTKSPEHNWIRSLAQFKLLQSIEKNEADMNAYICELMA